MGQFIARRFSRIVISALAVVLPVVSLGAPAAAGVALAGGPPYTRLIVSGGTTAFTPTTDGTDDLAWPEFAGAGDADAGLAPYDGAIVNRSASKGTGRGASSVNGNQKAKSNPQLVTSFDGLNHRQQRLANGGNQFSLEPPDQGLCVGKDDDSYCTSLG